MRKREVKKYGNSWIIKLEPSDIKDFELEEGSLLDVEELLILNKIKERKPKKK